MESPQLDQDFQLHDMVDTSNSLKLANAAPILKIPCTDMHHLNGVGFLTVQWVNLILNGTDFSGVEFVCVAACCRVGTRRPFTIFSNS